MKDTLLTALGALVLLAVGIIVVADSKARLAHYLQIVEDPIRTTGRVLDVQYDYGSDRGWRPSVRFEGHDGREYEFVSTSYYWQAWLAPDVGEEVPVLYSRNDPGVAVIDTLWGMLGSAAHWLLLGGFILLGLCVWAWQKLFSSE